MEQQYLADRLVRVNITIKNVDKGMVRLEVHYGRIVLVDTSREAPFLVQTIDEQGKDTQQWHKAYALWVIR